MKKSQDILGLLVFSIIDGREVGIVRDLIINPEEGSVEFLLVYSEDWLAGVRALPYTAVDGVGEHAVTTESENELFTLADNQGAITLVKRGIKVKGTRVLTKAGNIIGTVTEYSIDETTGKIAEVEWEMGSDDSGIIPADQVLTFGKDVLIFEDKPGTGSGPHKPSRPVTPAVEPASEAQVQPTAETPPAPAIEPVTEAPVVTVPAAPAAPAAPEFEQSEEKSGTQLFVERQKQFLSGKYLTKDILDNDGGVLAPAGTQLTPGLLNLLEIKGKLMEVSQNVR